jgi:hypothetical protein
MNPLPPGWIGPAVGHVLHRRGSHTCHAAAYGGNEAVGAAARAPRGAPLTDRQLPSSLTPR